MTDNIVTLEPATPKKSGIERKLVWLFFLLILFAGSLAFFTVAPRINQSTVATGSNNDALQEQINSLNNRIQMVEAKLNGIKEAPAAVVGTNDSTQAEPVLSARFSRMQNDIEGLSATLSALQSEIKAKDVIAAESREAATIQMADMLGFIALREAINSGRAFTNELAALRDHAKKDPEFQTMLTRLDSYAANGTPTLSMLHDTLVQREAAVHSALVKGAAQNWWQRLVASLQSLITVRSQHSGDAESLAQLETALAKGNAASSMEAFKALPADAQQNLADWQQQLTARQECDDVLRAINAHFTVVKAP